jgi:hypothetical protein
MSLPPEITGAAWADADSVLARRARRHPGLFCHVAAAVAEAFAPGASGSPAGAAYFLVRTGACLPFVATQPAAKPPKIAKSGLSTVTNRPINEPLVVAEEAAGMLENAGTLMAVTAFRQASTGMAEEQLFLAEHEVQADL